MEDIKKEFALVLLDIGAIKFGLFRLKLHEKKPDAPLSPIYIDLRILKSFPDAIEIIIRIYKKLIERLSFNLIADVPTAATPFVSILSYILKIPMISPRIEKKSHGLENKVEGVYKKGQTVVLIDDLITTSDSKIEVINILKENDLIVKDVVVLIDREQGGVKQLKKLGYNCYFFFKVKEILDIYLEERKIDKKEYLKVVDYLKSQ